MYVSVIIQLSYCKSFLSPVTVYESNVKSRGVYEKCQILMDFLPHPQCGGAPSIYNIHPRDPWNLVELWSLKVNFTFFSQICLLSFFRKSLANPLLEVDLCEQVHLLQLCTLDKKALFPGRKYHCTWKYVAQP